MSLADDYASRVTAAKDAARQAADSAPPSFHCATCDATVAPDGALSITPGTGTGSVALILGDAIRLRDWITATFG